LGKKLAGVASGPLETSINWRRLMNSKDAIFLTLARAANSLARIADALERAYPPPPVVSEPLGDPDIAVHDPVKFMMENFGDTSEDAEKIAASIKRIEAMLFMEKEENN
jgi:hypothetical protein